MSEFDNFCKSVKRAADMAVRKTGEVADITAKRVKLHRIDSKLSERYEVLGKLTYKQLKTGESFAEKIALYMDSIDKLRNERKIVVAEIEAERSKQNAQIVDDEEMLDKLADDTEE